MTAGAASKPQALRRRAGFVADPATYFDVIEPRAATTEPPLLLIHGGSHTGACYLSTADGRPGWAYAFAAHGYPVVVPDWPGSGRSGYVPDAELTGELVVRGLGRVLQSLGRPAIVLTHSVSGTFGWKLLERYGPCIESLVAVAPGGPGNIMRPAEVLSESPELVEVCTVHGGPVLRLHRNQPFVVERGFALKKLIGAGKRFPASCIDAYLARLTPTAPRLLLERVNYAGSALRVDEFEHFKGKRVAVITGTDDADHPTSVDRPIVEWLNQHGARAQYIALGEHGIVGNGHMMMLEDNSDEIAAAIHAWLQSGHFPGGAS